MGKGPKGRAHHDDHGMPMGTSLRSFAHPTRSGVLSGGGRERGGRRGAGYTERAYLLARQPDFVRWNPGAGGRGQNS